MREMSAAAPSAKNGARPGEATHGSPVECGGVEEKQRERDATQRSREQRGVASRRKSNLRSESRDGGPEEKAPPPRRRTR